jgi:hypothetical protein
MKTLLRIVIILAVALAVTGALYVVGQSEWAMAQLAGDRPAMAEGAEGGRPMPDMSGAAATLGVTTEALTAAFGSFPPDYEQAAATLGLPEADVQAAVEASLGALRGERREGGEQGGAFNVASLATFGRVLLPMVIVIASVTALRTLWDWGRQRNRQPATA